MAAFGLGYWMFGIRGAALFGGVMLACVVVYRYVARFAPRVVSATFLAIAACLLYSCATLGWGEADAPDGSRFKASPVGLSHVLTPDQATSRTEDCGWYEASGYASPCVIADRNAFAELKLIYPFVIAGAVLCVLAALSTLVRRSWSARGQRILACVAAGLAIAAPILFGHTATEALAALRGLPFGVGGSLGTMQLLVAILMCLTVCTVPPRRGGLSAER